MGQQLAGLPRRHWVVEQVPGIFKLEEAAFDFGGEVADGGIRVGNLAQQRGGEADHCFQIAQMAGELFGGRFGLDDFPAFTLEKLSTGPRPGRRISTATISVALFDGSARGLGAHRVHGEKMPRR